MGPPTNKILDDPMIDYSTQVHDNAKTLILAMDRGKIVERGTHEELLVVDGLYAQLYEMQFNMT
jgi:ABC-type transport system involved in cytochrome bd biosynthesis fused ATPase/permease subunit